MSYKISEGIDEAQLADFIRNALKKYGYYKNTKAVDYTKADIAPIVMCTVKCGEEILIAKRGYGLADAEGYWSTINGFIDEAKPVKHFVLQEAKEELGLNIKPAQIKVGESYMLRNPKEKRVYIVFPCLITFNQKPSIKLDREHTDFVWIKRSELESHEILDDLPFAIDRALSLGNT